jgi:hypothetical protein
VGGRPIGRCGCDCGCACAAAQDKAKTDRATINLQSRLFFPHVIFIPGDQFIQISHDIIILWIDFGHDVQIIRRCCPRDWMMRGDSHADHDDCHSGRCNKSSHAKPVSRRPETSRLLADVSYHIAGEEWRKSGLGSTAQNIPQLLVVFRFHSLQSIELFAGSEVALEWTPKIHIISLGLQGNLQVVGYASDAAFCARPLLQSDESAHG